MVEVMIFLESVETMEHVWVVVSKLSKVLELNNNVSFGFNVLDSNVLSFENIVIEVMIFLDIWHMMRMMEFWMLMSKNKVLKRDINVSCCLDFLDSNILGFEKIVVEVVIFLDIEEMRMMEFWVVSMVFFSKVLESNVNVSFSHDFTNSDVLSLENIVVEVMILLKSVEHVWVVVLCFLLEILEVECHLYLFLFLKLITF